MSQSPLPEKTSQENAAIALKHRLYVSGWELRKALKAAVDDDCFIVKLFWKDGVPVGVCLYSRYIWQIQCFVRKAERGQGIGTKLVRDVMKAIPNGMEVEAGEGLKGTRRFWTRNEIRCTSFRH